MAYQTRISNIMETRKLRRLQRLLPRELVDLASKTRHPLSEFDDFELAAKPCLVLGELKHWRALRLWLPPWRYLSSLTAAAPPLDVAALPPGGQLTGAQTQQYLSMSFDDFLDFDGKRHIRVESVGSPRLDSLPSAVSHRFPQDDTGPAGLVTAHDRPASPGDGGREDWPGGEPVAEC